MKFCIHRGTQEIGGTCVEIESQNKRVVLDVGLPLDDDAAATMDLHPVPGFAKPDPSLLGVVISHPHADHYGLADRLPAETPFLIGEGAQAILEAADLFTPAGLKLQNTTHMFDRQPIRLGPFTITPYLIDHSAYDSFAVLVEADGKRLFYSGDFRAHGRKASTTERLIADPPQDIDVLLMEGTTLGRPESAGGFPTEDDLVSEMVEQFESTDGMALVWASGQNIDRLVTLYKACRKAKRQLILDVYTAHVLREIKNPRLPQPGWRDIRIYLPRSQRRRVIQNKAFELIEQLKPFRIYPEAIPGEAERSVMLFRPSMTNELDEIEGLKLGRIIVSVWGGYLEHDRQKPLIEWAQERSIPIDRCHTSGHADTSTLLAFREAVNSRKTYLVHHEPDSHKVNIPNTLKIGDGQWLEY